MKLYVENLGSIKRADIELRDLTIFIGENNTNKTWTAYLIYALVKDYYIDEILDTLNYLKEILVGNKKSYEEILKNLNHDTLANFLNEKILPAYINNLKTKLPDFLYVKTKTLENLKIDIKFTEEEIKTLLNIIKNRDLAKYKDKIKFFRDVFNEFKKVVIGNPINIPAERNLLVLFSQLIMLGELNINELKEKIIAKVLEEYKDEKNISDETVLKFILKKLFSLFEPDIDIEPTYPKPISDFKNFISRLPTYREKEEKINIELLKLLELSIMEGEILSDEGSKLKYRFKENELELSSSSSMIKGLTGLYLYLKYKAEKGDLLIIDEPEINLHPEAQVKMIEFLTILVNKGIKVLITTHSPYIVDHLINLIEGYNSNNPDKNKLFWLPKYIDKRFEVISNKDIYISKDKVSIYHFSKNGYVKDILNEDGTIDWETFSRISDKISSIYYEL
jgi:predicted ATPase